MVRRCWSPIGNKARAISAARQDGLPVLASTVPSADVDTLPAAAEQIPFPVLVEVGCRPGPTAPPAPPAPPHS